MDINNYDYNLPEELIAKVPVEPRDSSRLMVVNTQKNEIKIVSFAEIVDYLPANSHLVFNETKVLPARVFLSKETGGKVEVLFLVNEYQAGDEVIRGMVDRKVVEGQKLFFDKDHYVIAVLQEENIFSFRPNFEWEKLDELLRIYGVTPVPHYLDGPEFTEDFLRDRYQSIFATKPASVAAPTASLHFTKAVLKEVEEKGITQAKLNLKVGLGTFAPVTNEHIESKKLHTEYYEIEKAEGEKIAKALEIGDPIIPVGTTALRALESAADELWDGAAQTIEKKTNLFIYPPYRFTVATGLVTNFHLPKSSLMMLVDAFLEHKQSPWRIQELYERAIKEKLRFYSFGDAMLIL